MPQDIPPAAPSLCFLPSALHLLRWHLHGVPHSQHPAEVWFRLRPGSPEALCAGVRCSLSWPDDRRLSYPLRMKNSCFEKGNRKQVGMKGTLRTYHVLWAWRGREVVSLLCGSPPPLWSKEGLPCPSSAATSEMGPGRTSFLGAIGLQQLSS